MTLSFIWNFDPQILSTGPFQFRWLTILLVTGVLLARFILFKFYNEKDNSKVEAKAIFNFSMIGAVVGARLLYVFAIEPKLLTKPLQIFFPFEFSQGLRFTGDGQFSLMGALLGMMVSAYLYSTIKKKSALASLDKVLLLFVVVLVFLRIGNFFQSDYYGKATNASSGALFLNPIKKGIAKIPCCAMRNPNGENPLDTVSIKPGNTIIHEGIGYKPVIIYLFFKEGATEQLVNEFLIGDVKTFLYDQSELIHEPGTEPLHYTIFVEGKENNYMARILTTAIARHPLQLYEGITFLGILVFLLWFMIKKKSSTIPGKQGAILILIFSLFHFFFEFLSTTKPAIKSLNLTPDQIFCIVFFIFGTVLLYFSVKKKSSLT